MSGHVLSIADDEDGLLPGGTLSTAKEEFMGAIEKNQFNGRRF